MRERSELVGRIMIAVCIALFVGLIALSEWRVVIALVALSVTILVAVQVARACWPADVLGILLLGIGTRFFVALAASELIKVPEDVVLYEARARAVNVLGITKAASFNFLETDLRGIILVHAETQSLGPSIISSKLLVAFLTAAAYSIAGLLILRTLSRWMEAGPVLGFRPDPKKTLRVCAVLLALPAQIYWGASPGKEGFVALSIALVVYGLSLGRRREAIIFLVVGEVGLYLFRPYLAYATIAVVLALFWLAALRRWQSRAAFVITVIGAGLLIIPFVELVLGQSLAEQQEQIALAGGDSLSIAPGDPLRDVKSIVRTIFTPAPFIAPQSLIWWGSLLEGFVVGFFLIAVVRRCWRIKSLGDTRAQAYAIAFGISTLLVYGFGGANEGTAYRVRAPIIMLLIPFFAVVWVTRRAARLRDDVPHHELDPAGAGAS